MTTQERASYHEAGHIVAYFAYGWTIKSANIKQFEREDHGGTVAGQTFVEENHKISAVDLLLSGITCTLAGPLSEQKAAGDKPGNITMTFREDAEHVFALCAELSREEADMKGIAQHGMNHALDLIVLQWKAIEGVAKALQEKTEISEAEITELCTALLSKKQNTASAPPSLLDSKTALKRLKKQPKPPTFVPKNWVDGEDYTGA
jgi:hypothetical protein